MESQQQVQRLTNSTPINYANNGKEITPESVFAAGSILKAITPAEHVTKKVDHNAKDSADFRNPCPSIGSAKSDTSDIDSCSDSDTNSATDKDMPNDTANEGWLTSGLRAVTGFATRITVNTLEAAAPYLGAMADTAYQTAKAESETVQRLEQVALETADKTKELRTLGEELVASADRTEKHLNNIKADRAAAEAASTALKKSGGDLLKRMAVQGTAATACVAGLGALQQLLAHGSTGIIGSLPFASMPLGTVAIAGSALALCSPQGVAFCQAAAKMTQSLFSGGNAGADAATELAESAVSAQRAAGNALTSIPNSNLLGLAS